MNKIVSKFVTLGADRRAVTALEYGLIAGLIAAVLIGVLGTLGTNIQSVFTSIASKV